jgi:hypothetical protein
MPVSSIEPQEIKWQGQTFPIGSTQTFSDWTVTFRLDAAARLRKDFNRWMRFIHDPVTNIHGIPNFYMIDQEVWHLNTQGFVINRLKLVNAFPTSVGELSLDYSATEPATFDVTFRYLYHIEI